MGRPRKYPKKDNPYLKHFYPISIRMPEAARVIMEDIPNITNFCIEAINEKLVKEGYVSDRQVIYTESNRMMAERIMKAENSEEFWNA